jgi:hypothetical protein
MPDPLPDTTLDAIAAVVGYSLTRDIVAWYEGRALWLPRTAQADHPLAVLIGIRPLRALVRAFGGGRLAIPTAAQDNRARRERSIAERLASGASAADIAAEHDLSVRRVLQLREELALRGWITYAEGFGTRKRWRAPAEILGTGDVPGEPPPL